KNITNINSVPLTKQAEKVIRVTVLEAKSLKSENVETEHLMLSILKNKENICTQMLKQFGITYETFKGEITGDIDILSSSHPTAEFTEDPEADYGDERRTPPRARRSKSKSRTPVLDNFG